MAADAMAAVCPLDDRRTANELILKLFAAQVTMVVAYCHLLSLRQAKLVSWEPYLYALCPILPVVRLALGLILSVIPLVFRTLRHPTTINTNTRLFLLRLRLLIGKPRLRRPETPGRGARRPSVSAPPIRVNTLTLESQSATDRQHGAPTSIQSRLNASYVAFWRIAALAWTAFLSCTTIHLFRRRLILAGWDSITVVDSRALELAISGIVIFLMSVAVVAEIPWVSDIVPVIQGWEHDALSSFVMEVCNNVDCWDGTSAGKPEPHSTGYITLGIFFPLSLWAGVPIVIQVLLPFLADVNIVRVAIALSIWLACIIAYTEETQPRRIFGVEINSELKGAVFSMVLIVSVVVFSEVYVWTMIAMMISSQFLLIGGLVALVTRFFELVLVLGEELSAAKNGWPVDVPCPQLWKDSLSEWLLSLA